MNKKIFTAAAAAILCIAAAAQEPTAAQKAAIEAAQAVAEAPLVQPKKPTFSSFWNESLKTNINFGQTALSNWAAGGDNSYSLAAYIDGNANFKQGDMFWNNRLQLDFGFMYAASKPLLQKNTDRIYLESKFGYQVHQDLYVSANFDFRSQFAKGYDYKTPATKYKTDDAGAQILDEGGAPIPIDPTRKDWRDARVLRSGFFAPAYFNLALGIDWKPTKWFSASLAPITGGYVAVTDPTLRTAYSMKMRKEYSALADDDAKKVEALKSGKAYRAGRAEFGAQLKVDMKFNINDVFSYTTQLVIFEDYIKSHKQYPCPRINWDNRIDWKLAKYFSLCLTTNMIYDQMVKIKTDKHPEGGRALQFKEALAFGFTYSIVSKK